MKVYEKPVVELVSFQAEEIMFDPNSVNEFALSGHMGYSDISTIAV